MKKYFIINSGKETSWNTYDTEKEASEKATEIWNRMTREDKKNTTEFLVAQGEYDEEKEPIWESLETIKIIYRKERICD